MNDMIDPVDPPLVDRVHQLWAESAAWLFSHSTRIILAGALGAIIVALLVAAKWFGGRICATDLRRDQWRSVIGKALSTTRLWFMLAVAAQIVAKYAHAPDDLATTVNFLFVIASTLQAAVFGRALILGMIEYRAVGHESLGNALNIIRVLVTIAVFSIAVVLILSNLGVNVTGLMAGLGIGGIAIGLAAQGIFKDLFAALSILFDRPFRVTDLIKFGDVTGQVEAIGLKTTRIRSLDGEQVIMSNDKLLDQQIRNFQGIESRRIILTVPLHYLNDPAKLASLPDGIGAVAGKIADSRFVSARLTSCDANAVMLEIIAYATKGDAEVRDRVRHLTIVATLAYLAETGISISYQGNPPKSPPPSKADVVER